MWQRHYDEEGNAFFFDPESGVSQWEEPEEFEEAVAEDSYYHDQEEVAAGEEWDEEAIARYYAYYGQDGYQQDGQEYPEGYQYDESQGTEGYQQDGQEYPEGYQNDGQVHPEGHQYEGQEYLGGYQYEGQVYDQQYDNQEGYQHDGQVHGSYQNETHVQTLTDQQNGDYAQEDYQYQHEGQEQGGDKYRYGDQTNGPKHNGWIQEGQYTEQNQEDSQCDSVEQVPGGLSQTIRNQQECSDLPEDQNASHAIGFANDHPQEESQEVNSGQSTEQQTSDTSEPVATDIQAKENQSSGKVIESHADENETQERVDPATLIPDYSEEDMPLIEEILSFELNEECPSFKEELFRLHLMENPCESEVTAIKEGKWCTASCKKLEMFQYCLENAGTEDEWKELFEDENCHLVDYLLMFMTPGVHPQLKDGAARCFAYAFMVCPSLWTFYGGLREGDCKFIYLIVAASEERIQFLANLPAEGPTIGPYLGFDERDIKDFNLYDLEEEEKQEEAPFQMLGSSDANTMASVWCLVLFQLFRSNMRQIGDSFRNRRVMALGLEGEDGGDESKLSDPTDLMLHCLRELLLTSHKLREDSYLILVKSVAALNWQIPEKDLVGSTEVAEICAELQFQDTADSSVNISEGLMHLINDIGYPEHHQPESLPCLQLCYDLVHAPGYEGFFYLNDVRILIDVIIREVTNLPATKPKEEVIFEREVENFDSDEEDEGERVYRTRQSTIDMNAGMSICDGVDGPVELFASEVTPFDELMKQVCNRRRIYMYSKNNNIDIVMVIVNIVEKSLFILMSALLFKYYSSFSVDARVYFAFALLYRQCDFT